MPVMHNTHIYKATKNSPNLWLKNFPWKKPSGHKYSRGKVVVYGGKKELIGATILSSLAALRTGTGSVKIICSKSTGGRFQSIFKAQFKILNRNSNINSIFFFQGGCTTTTTTTTTVGKTYYYYDN